MRLQSPGLVLSFKSCRKYLTFTAASYSGLAVCCLDFMDSTLSRRLLKSIKLKEKQKFRFPRPAVPPRRLTIELRSTSKLKPSPPSPVATSRASSTQRPMGSRCAPRPLLPNRKPASSTIALLTTGECSSLLFSFPFLCPFLFYLIRPKSAPTPHQKQNRFDKLFLFLFNP